MSNLFSGQITDLQSVIEGPYFTNSPKTVYLIEINLFNKPEILKFDIIKKDENFIYGFIWDLKNKNRYYTRYPLNLNLIDKEIYSFASYESAEKYLAWYKLRKD